MAKGALYKLLSFDTLSVISTFISGLKNLNCVLPFSFALYIAVSAFFIKVSTSLNILLEGKWKRYIEKTKINIFLNKIFNKNLNQCSGYNFILKK